MRERAHKPVLLPRQLIGALLRHSRGEGGEDGERGRGVKEGAERAEEKDKEEKAAGEKAAATAREVEAHVLGQWSHASASSFVDARRLGEHRRHRAPPRLLSAGGRRGGEGHQVKQGAEGRRR